MKNLLLIFLFFVSSLGFAQNNYIVKTEDGRRVLLKADFTWEYIDMVKPTDSISKTASEIVKPTNCNIAEDFQEPKLDSKIQSQLKKGRATIDYVKKKVAKDYNCEVSDVVLLSFSEQKSKGVYHFCANGTKVTYKRNGFSIIKSVKLF